MSGPFIELLLDPPCGLGSAGALALGGYLSIILRRRHALVSSACGPSEPGGVCTVLVFASLIAGCVFGGGSCSTRQAPSPDARSFTDELGRTVWIKPFPTRIVSLAPSITETLFALGLGEQTVGVTNYCDYPLEAQQKERVGDTLRPSIEKIVSLRPDLVIASSSSQLEQFVRNLDQLNMPIYVSNPRDIEGVLSSIERIGEIAAVEERAHKVASELRARLEAVTRRVEAHERPRVLFILGGEPLITPGRPSFINDLITRAGGQSVSGDEPSDYPQFSLETAVARRPEVIFLQSGEEKLPERLKLTPAARAGRVFRLSNDLLLRPGPRIIEGLEQMAKRVHPEAFDGGAPAAAMLEQAPHGHARATERISF